MVVAVTDQEERWAAVGRAIRDRMDAMHPPINQTQLVARSGVSAATVRPLMHGKPGNYTRTKLARVCAALEWPSDAIEMILEDPTYQPDAAALEQEEELDHQVADLRRRVRRLHQRVRRLERDHRSARAPRMGGEVSDVDAIAGGEALAEEELRRLRQGGPRHASS